jgi:hypothetical protein
MSVEIIEQQQAQSTNAAMRCGFITVSLWKFFPVNRELTAEFNCLTNFKQIKGAAVSGMLAPLTDERLSEALHNP